MTLKFKLVVHLYTFFSKLLGEDHKLTYYFWESRQRMLDAYRADDYELLSMLCYPEKL